MLIFCFLSSTFFFFGIFWFFVISARAVKYGLREYVCILIFCVSFHVVSSAVYLIITSRVEAIATVSLYRRALPSLNARRIL